MIRTLFQDLRHSVRMLRHAPGFTALAVTILALGIGANTAIFSLVNAVLLRPLPFPEADRLVFAWSRSQEREPGSGPGQGSEQGQERRSVSYPDFLDWQRESRAFSELAAFSNPTCTLQGGTGGEESSERIPGELVSASYFSLLGVSAAVGRTFLPEEDLVPGTNRVVVISHALWQRRFGRDPALVGRPLMLNGHSYEVIGIAPPSFRGITGQAEVWMPMILQAEVIPELAELDPVHRREVRWHAVLGRLASGMDRERATSELGALARRLQAEYPDSNNNLGGVTLVPLGEQLFGSFRLPLLLLLGAVILVLSIACANLANLQLARSLTRQQEVAVRTALGARRGRLMGQLLEENLILALLGAAVGIALAALLVAGLSSALAAQLPNYIAPGLDGRVLAFALLLSLGTSLSFGLFPALRVTKVEVATWLRNSSRGSTGGAGGHRARDFLVGFEMAIALVLLIFAGLLIRGLYQVRTLDLGFDPGNRLSLRLDLPVGEYSGGEIAALGHRLLGEIGALPGIATVALASDVPFDDRESAIRITIEGYEPPPPEEAVRVYEHRITPGFFNGLGIHLVAGRDFTAADGEGGAPVAIVSQSMARRYWPGEDPLGKRLKKGRRSVSEPWHTVVGVVEDSRYRTLLADPNRDPDVYFPFFQAPLPSFALLASTRLPPESLVGTLRTKMQELYPSLPVYNVSTLEERVAAEASNSRLTALLMMLFATVALGLTTLGLYGLVAYSVRQRTRELGIRLALGATPGAIERLVVWEGFRVALPGAGAGLLLALAATRLLGGLLYGISATDPLIFLAITVILIAVALLASFLPARQAARVSPVVSLRRA